MPRSAATPAPSILERQRVTFRQEHPPGAAPLSDFDPGEWHPRIPERLDEEELADWRAGRNAVYQLAARTVGARLAVADA